MPSLTEDRIKRLSEAVPGVSIHDPQGLLGSPCPWVGIASSRLGHDPNTHRHVGQFLIRSLLDCRSRHGILVIAAGSAIEPWAVRAATLFKVPLLRIIVGQETPSQSTDKTTTPLDRWKIWVTRPGASLSRDEVLVAMADWLDVVHVRKRGRISAAVQERLRRSSDASIRVAISPATACDAVRLMDLGAVGWVDSADQPSSGPSNQPSNQPSDQLSPSRRPQGTLEVDPFSVWAKQSGRWLVHCTRASQEGWPDETQQQYRDAILLGDASSVQRGPLQALCRILGSRCLLASSIATAKAHRVVCFTEVSLQEILSRRCFRPHLGRWDYEPFGVGISMDAGKRIGIRRVIYGQPDERSKLAAEDRFRFHPVGKTYDWTAEKEWRSPVMIDLSQFHADELQVFALHSAQAEQKLKSCGIPITWVKTRKDERQAEAEAEEDDLLW